MLAEELCQRNYSQDLLSNQIHNLDSPSLLFLIKRDVVIVILQLVPDTLISFRHVFNLISPISQPQQRNISKKYNLPLPNPYHPQTRPLPLLIQLHSIQPIFITEHPQTSILRITIQNINASISTQQYPDPNKDQFGLHATFLSIILFLQKTAGEFSMRGGLLLIYFQVEMHVFALISVYIIEVEVVIAIEANYKLDNLINSRASLYPR